MDHFKNMLVEALSDTKREEYSKYEVKPEMRAATDHFFGKGNDKVTGPIVHDHDDGHHSKSELHGEIERHIGSPLSVHQFKNNQFTDKHGRPTTVAKQIKDQGLRDRYAADHTTIGDGDGYTFSTHRGVEVAGQTSQHSDELHPTGHSWRDQSCKNNEKGNNKRYLRHEIEHGTVVHFVHDHDGKEIYRATLQPHHSKEGHVAYSVDAEYGIKHPSFTKSAHAAAIGLSGPGDKHVLYKKSSKVYNDNGRKFMAHPSLDTDEIDEKVYANHVHPDMKVALAAHPNTSDHALMHLIDNGDEHVHKAVVDNPNVEAHHLEAIANKSVRSGKLFQREAALRHPKMPGHVAEKFLEKGQLVSAAASNPNLTQRGVELAMNNVWAKGNVLQSKNVTKKQLDDHADEHPLSVSANNKTSPETLHRIAERSAAIGHASHAEREATTNVAKHQRARPDTMALIAKSAHVDHREAAARHRATPDASIHTLMNDSSAKVRKAVMQNVFLKPEHLDAAVASKKADVRVAAMSHPKATADHIKKGLMDSNSDVRSAAIKAIKKHHVDAEAIYDDSRHGDVKEAMLKHPSASRGLLNKAIDNGDSIQANHALNSPNATKAHLDRAFLKGHDDVVVRHPNATSKMLDHLHKVGSKGIQLAAIRHPNASPSLLHDVATNGGAGDYMTGEAISHPKLPKSAVSAILKSGDKERISTLAANSKGMDDATRAKTVKHLGSYDVKSMIRHGDGVGPKTLHAIATHPDNKDLHRDILAKEATSTETLHHIAKSMNGSFDDRSNASAIISHPNFKHEIFSTLDKSPSGIVRAVAAAHPSRTPEELEGLSKSKDRYALSGVNSNKSAPSKMRKQAEVDYHNLPK